MLQAQVNYWNLMESKRHNIETEKITWFANYETQRHNVQTENLGWATLAETERHNKVSEQQGWESIDVARTNAQTNIFNAHTQRYAQQEQARHNLVTEDVSWFNAYSQRISANASALSASAQMKQADTQRQSMINQGVRWASQTANEQRQTQIAQGQLDVAKQNARTNLYNAKLYASRLLVQNSTDTWNTIERAAPDVPMVSIRPEWETGEIGHYPW